MGKMKELYKASKAAKVGDTCICPACRAEFVKTSYQQAFCKSKPGTECKDKYWNTVTPEKRCNRTRISPASARWLEENKDMLAQRKGYPDHDTMMHDIDEGHDDPIHGGPIELDRCHICKLRADYCRCGEGVID